MAELARGALPPIRLDGVLAEPEALRRLVERNAPYFPVQRYFVNSAQAAVAEPGIASFIAPNFRGDWAYDRPLVEGAEQLLNHAGFIDAAQRIFDATEVRPQQVYANLTWQLPFAQGSGHTDVPAFRGVDRTTVPTSILSMMGWSGLFERWRVEIATAVSWWYQGADGGFEYWPEGPDAAARVHEGSIFNTAIVGDNDFMYHRVRPVGAPADGLPQGMSLETRLAWLGGERWEVRDGDRVFGTPRWDDLRISVSWKAMVFRRAEDAALYDDHADDLGLEQVFEILYADLAQRGIDHPKPADPVNHPELFSLLAATYRPEPPPRAAA